LEWTITDGSTLTGCSKCGHNSLSQDIDTFDTWFSSSQWPFATLQSAKNGDFEKFYPTSVMDPSYDILPFWVIRMIMLGLYVTQKEPFKNVLLHGLVRDKFGVKISKSKGNVIDPIEMADKYGADALRMASIWGISVENDNSLSEENINGQRKFANKVWNIARFVLSNKSGSQISKLKSQNYILNVKSKNTDDEWILKELSETIKKVTKYLDKYRFNEAAEEIYDFIWHKFADIYIEKTKERREKAQPILEKAIIDSLKLLHPFMPFVTEQIWKEMGNRDLLINSSWPKA
jgi:valyl-tRNA synthetase